MCAVATAAAARRQRPRRPRFKAAGYVRSGVSGFRGEVDKERQSATDPM